MNLAAHLFPSWLLILSNVLALGVLAWAILTEHWRALPQNALTSWLGGVVCVLFFWQLKAQVHEGLSFHLLGASALALIAGRQRALVGIAAALCIDIAYGHGDFAAWGLSFLLGGLLPISCTQLLLHFAQQKLPPNYFIYIFLNCFAASAASMCLVGLGVCISLSSSYPVDFLFNEAFPYYLLMAWPEAFTTGFSLTLLVIWRPEWVHSFDDQLYLRK